MSDDESKPAIMLPRREFFGVAAGAVLSLSAGCAESPDASDSGDSGTGGTDETEGPPTDLPPEDPGPRIDFDPEAIPESVELFPRTPIAGEMKPDSFMIAGHVTTAEAITVRVWQPSEVEGEVFVIAEHPVSPDARGFFKLTVEDLVGGEWYDYGLFTGEPDDFSARSLLCRVRTALPEGAREPVRVAIAACVGRGVVLPEYVDPDDPQPVAPWDALSQTAEHDYDLFIHLGDQGYFDQVWDAGGSLEQYLAAWGAYHGGGYREVYPKTGLYCTWDDHEVTNNGTVDPWTQDPVERERIANAKRAYFTVLPIDASEPEDRLWRSFKWGDTVEFIVLDCRYERQAPETGVYLGDEQFQFLLDRLENSPCHFKCVVNSVPFARLNLSPDLPLIDLLVQPEDRWEGYVTQRAQVQARVDELELRNILWVTGDVHMCWVGQVDGEPTSASESMWEICVTSGNINALASELPQSQFPWASPAPHLPLITFDPEADLVRVEFFDRWGNLSHSQELQLG